ncbi:hypothetical protein J132_11053 [Termitomyces sp. J132]|nr:hypothetical protein J132_11053 [Termitomyces sp. J132]
MVDTNSPVFGSNNIIPGESTPIQIKKKLRYQPCIEEDQVENPQAGRSGLISDQERVVSLACQSMMDKEREHINWWADQAHRARSKETKFWADENFNDSESSDTEDDSLDKSKGFNLHNWGGLDLSDTEVDLGLQHQLLDDVGLRSDAPTHRGGSELTDSGAATEQTKNPIVGNKVTTESVTTRSPKPRTSSIKTPNPQKDPQHSAELLPMPRAYFG